MQAKTEMSPFDPSFASSRGEMAKISRRTRCRYVFEHCTARDYGLCAAHGDIVSDGPGLDWDADESDSAGDGASKSAPMPLLYVYSPKDVVVARPRDVEDHVSWALEGADFAKALDIGQRFESSLGRYSLIDLAQRYLGHLLSVQEYELAAEKLPSFKSDIKLREKGQSLQSIGNCTCSPRRCPCPAKMLRRGASRPTCTK